MSFKRRNKTNPVYAVNLAAHFPSSKISKAKILLKLCAILSSKIGSYVDGYMDGIQTLPNGEFPMEILLNS